MKNILIIKHGSLGDIAFSLPAIISIRRKYINSSITLLTESKYVDFFNRSKLFDKIIEDNRTHSYFVTLKKLLFLIKFDFDSIIDLQNSQRTSFYNFFFRIFHKAKISSSRAFAHYRYLIPVQGTEGATQGLLNQIKMIGIDTAKNIEYDWLLETIEQQNKNPIALFIPGGSSKSKNRRWQPEKFAQVAKYYENLNHSVFVVGTYRDKSSMLPILQNCSNAVDLTDKSPPEIIFSIAKISSIIITNDTGPGHIAALTKNKIIWLANNNNVTQANLPQHSNCFKIISDSIKDISYKEVIKFIEKNNLY